MTSRRDFLKALGGSVAALEGYRRIDGVQSIADLDTIPDRSLAVLTGEITNLRVRPLRGDKGSMAVFDLRDQTRSVECVCFSREYEKYQHRLLNETQVEIAVSVRRSAPVDERTGDSIPGKSELRVQLVAVAS